MARKVGSPSSAKPEPVHVRFDRFELDEADARLMRDGTPLALAPTPFALLCALVRQPGSLLTKQALLDEVWGHQFVSESVLKTVISELRTALDDDARRPRFIETVSRRGYRFIADTTAMQVAAPAPSAGMHAEPQRVTAFVGRTDALSRLRRAWDAACGGKRSIVWVAGEPGIGKTTLIEQFIGSLGEVVVARGQCVEHYGAGEPYLPVLEALSQLCRIDPALVPLLRAVAPTWLLQLPWLSTAEERDALRRELAGIGADRMLREMGELLDRCADRRPLLLVTEDLHWSDRSTIQLIDYVARRRGSARLMWLASFRIAEVVALDHPLNTLRHELRLHDLCEEIVLDPFSENEVADYVAQRWPDVAADEAFVRALHARTDGMPLFVASIMDEAMSRGAHKQHDVVVPPSLGNIAVPENLAAIIDHYIAKLTGDQRALLSAAAVCGIDFSVATVSAALERDAGWVAQLCDELVRGHVWLTAARASDDGLAGGRHAFRHALFRQVLYERTNPTIRAQLHRMVGAALERERAAGASIAATELAMHFDRGGASTAALRYYAEAAEAALRHFSPTQSIALCERALALLDDAPAGVERDALEITLATLHGVATTHAHGMTSDARDSLQRAYGLLDNVPQHPMNRQLLHGLAFVLSLRAEYAEVLAVAKRAEQLSATLNDPLLLLAACIAHAEVHHLLGEPRAAIEWIERGLAVTDRIDVAAEEIFVADPQATLLGLLAIELVVLGRVGQARARIADARARAERGATPMTRLVALWFEALLEVRLGDADRVAVLADDMRKLVDAYTLEQGRAAAQWFAGWADAQRGEPAAAYPRIRQAYEDNTRLGMLAGGSEVLAYAVEALVLARDWDAAQRELAHAMDAASARRERMYMPPLLMLEAAIARGRGERAAADASLRRAMSEAASQQTPWYELLALIDLCEHGRPTADERRRVAALVDELRDAADTVAASRARALLAKRPA